MPDDRTVGRLPEFTTDEGVTKEEEVKEVIPPEGEIPDEKDTQSEPPADNQPGTPVGADDATSKEREIEGLQREKEKLLRQIVELKGQRREIKQEEIRKIDDKIDNLEDINKNDLDIMERVLKAKGYMTREESNKLLYEKIKDEELNGFLEKYPEYKPENDPNDTNWSLLQSELRYYRSPDDPKQIRQILERAHRSVSKPTLGDRTAQQVKKHNIAVASTGAGGSQRSSSGKSLDPAKRLMLAQGGWSEEEIKNIEKNLE